MRHVAYPSEGEQSDVCPPSHVQCDGLMCVVDDTSKVIGSQQRRTTVPTPSPPRSGIISPKHPTSQNSRRRGTLAGWLSARSVSRRGDEHKTRSAVPPRALSTREKGNPQEFSSVIYSGQGMNVEDTCSPSSFKLRHTDDFEEDCAPALAAKHAQEGRLMRPSQENIFHDNKYSFRQRTGGVKKWKEPKNAVSDPPMRQVTFSAADNVNLRIDSDPADLDPMEDSSLASPCVGTIQFSSPRYITFQKFRKFMASQGIDAQILYPGWVRKVLAPRSIRIFVTDGKKDSAIWWRYRKPCLGRGDAGASRESDLGASGCRTIPLSALASVGPAEVAPKATDGRRFSWAKRSRKQSYLRRSLDNQIPDEGAEGSDPESRRKDNSDVPILGLSYWNSGSPRWAGDQPRVLQIKLETLEAFQRLAEGLRLCCLHFFDNPWPQDLVDTL